MSTGFRYKLALWLSILRDWSYFVFSTVKTRLNIHFNQHKIPESISAWDLSLRPSPFKIVHMITDGRINESFLKLTKIPNTRVTRIEATPRYDDISSSERLNHLLKATMKDLTKLTIHFRCNRLQHIFKGVKLLALQSLSIAFLHVKVKSSRACNCLESLNLALENTRLHTFSVNSKAFDDGFCSLSMLTINLSSIVKLSLKTNSEYNIWNLFPQGLQLPALKTFSFESTQGRDECKEKRLNVFLRSVASNLNKLTFCWYPIEVDRSLIFRGIMFPQLQFLSVFCPKDISSFVTQERFPSLKAFAVQVTEIHQMQFICDRTDSLSTVRYVSVGLLLVVERQVGLINSMFSGFILNLANTFPRTESLEMMLAAHSLSFSLLDIGRAYPNLEYLRIDSTGLGLCLCGTWKIERKLCEKARLKTEALKEPNPIEPSLLAFKKLKSLILGVEISTEAFQHCLSRMTALEELTFTYRPGPSVEVLADSLKHVKTLTIYCETGISQMNQTLLALPEALPCSEISFKNLF